VQVVRRDNLCETSTSVVAAKLGDLRLTANKLYASSRLPQREGVFFNIAEVWLAALHICMPSQCVMFMD
jgi:hypothetical protein